MSPAAGDDVAGDALAVLMASFPGTQVPGWLRAALAGGLGSVCLFGSNATGDDARLRALTDELHAAAGPGAGDRPGTVVAIDEEGGDVTRLDAVRGSSLPSPAALGRADDVGLTGVVATALAARLRAVGVDLDLAPVADVDVDPRNPVIGIRSFGPDPQVVARHVAAVVTHLQRGGVAACAKHFPGHGATTQDSHLTLPAVTAPVAELADRELVPFRAAVQAGAEAVMSGHLLVPAVDPGGPASTSAAVTALLRESLGFDGVLVTDALDMHGVSGTSGHGSVPAAAVAALRSGADLLCLGAEGTGEMLTAVAAAVEDAVRAGTLPRARLAEAAARVRALAWRAARRRAGTVPPGAPSCGPDAEGVAAAVAEVARRALSLDGEPGPVPGALVVRLTGTPNIAVGVVPWGLAATTGDPLPGAEHVDAGPDGDVAAPLSRAAGRHLVAVVRDAGRTPWMHRMLAAFAAARPDLVVVEMGRPGAERLPGRAVLLTRGAGRSAAAAAVEVLAGAR